MRRTERHESTSYAIEAFEKYFESLDISKQDAVVMSQIDRTESDYGQNFSIEYTVKAEGRYFTPSYSFDTGSEALEAYEDHIEAIEKNFDDLNLFLMDPDQIRDSGPAGGNLLTH